MSTFHGKGLIKTRNIPLLEVVQRVVEELDWSVISSTDDQITLKEKDRFDYYNALEMTIRLVDVEDGHIEMRINAHNAGYGPVQDEYVKTQVLRFISAVKITIEKDFPDSEIDEDDDTNHSLSLELERLVKLHEEGELTDEEFKRAKEKVIDE